MNKKKYQQPTTDVVKVEVQQRLMSGSVSAEATRTSYGDAETQKWGEE